MIIDYISETRIPLLGILRYLDNNQDGQAYNFDIMMGLTSLCRKLCFEMCAILQQSSTLKAMAKPGSSKYSQEISLSDSKPMSYLELEALKKQVKEVENVSFEYDRNRLYMQYRLAVGYLRQGRVNEAFKLLQHVIAVHYLVVEANYETPTLHELTLDGRYLTDHQLEEVVPTIENMLNIFRCNIGEEIDNFRSCQILLSDANQVCHLIEEANEEKLACSTGIVSPAHGLELNIDEPNPSDSSAHREQVPLIVISAPEIVNIQQQRISFKRMNEQKRELQEGLEQLPAPIREAVTPWISNNQLSKQVEDRFRELQIRPHQMRKSAGEFLSESGSVSGRDNDSASDDEDYESSPLLSHFSHLPSELREAFYAIISKDPFRTEAWVRWREFVRYPQLASEVSLDLLHALKSVETRDEGEGSSRQPVSQEDLSKSASTRYYSDSPIREHTMSQSDPSSSSNQGRLAVDQRGLSSEQSEPENFFDWREFHSRPLQPKVDVLEAKHLALLAVYDTAKVRVASPTVNFQLTGMLTLLRHFLHKDDYLTFFRSVDRNILVTNDASDELSNQQLENLDTSLFDTTKFCGFDTRLTALTCNRGRYGTITLFNVGLQDTTPEKIRPISAMRSVPKVIIQKLSEGVQSSTRTKLSMPQDEIWTATKQTRVGNMRSAELRPALEPAWKTNSPTLRTALSMDYEEGIAVRATLPQMLTMLHHKTGIVENILSKPLEIDQPVAMIDGPAMAGYEDGRPRIVILGPTKGKWTETAISWI